MGSACNFSSETRSEKLLLDLELNDAWLKNEEFRLAVMQNEVAFKAMTRTIMELKKPEESFETENAFLLQISEKMLLQSCEMKSHTSVKKKMLISSVPGLIGVAVQMEDATHSWWWSKEGSELKQYEERNERNWKNRGQTVMELRVEG